MLLLKYEKTNYLTYAYSPKGQYTLFDILLSTQYSNH